MSRLRSEPIRVEELVEAVRSDRDGAVVLFVGTVRNHHRGRRVLSLEYHAYAEMAEAELAKIEREALRRFGVSAVAIVHRTGRLRIGEASVAIAVASAHRAEAFDASRFVIDAIKDSVPIWKKEFFEGGAAWVEGQQP